MMAKKKWKEIWKKEIYKVGGPRGLDGDNTSGRVVGKGSKRSWKRQEGKSGARARGRMRRKGRARKGRRGEWGENSKSGVRASYFNILSALRGITHTTSGRPIFETDHKRRSAASFLGKRNERTEYARTLHKKSRLDRKCTDLLVKNYARSRR